jgi:RimJ/RimL family protein N-acetyltransferase
VASSAQLRQVPDRLTGERVVLVVSDPAFAEVFADGLQHTDLTYLPGWIGAAQDVAVARASLSRSVELAGEDVVRHAFELGSGRYVGRLDLHSWDFATPRCELGYLADARMTGRGLVREAARLMLDLAWGLGAVRVQAMCDSRNERSIRFARALGLEPEGLLRQYERDAAGHLCDQVLLAVLADDRRAG